LCISFSPVACLCFCSAVPTSEISTLSLHDALPLWGRRSLGNRLDAGFRRLVGGGLIARGGRILRLGLHWCRRGIKPPPTSLRNRSEEHTSELQSHLNLVCRLLLEKNKNRTYTQHYW